MFHESKITDENVGFFRIAAAALVRYMIRAREKIEPGFLSSHMYNQWGLENIEEDRGTTESLLIKAYHEWLNIRDNYVLICPSGGIGVDDDDPLFEVKIQVGGFIYHYCELLQGIEDARAGRKVNVSGMAHWEDLPEIRAQLDRLPLPPRRTPGSHSLQQELENIPSYVSLDQMAALVGMSKRSLEHYKKKGLPAPAVKARRGAAQQWLYHEVRPWLEATFGRLLPDRPFSDRLNSLR